MLCRVKGGISGYLALLGCTFQEDSGVTDGLQLNGRLGLFSACSPINMIWPANRFHLQGYWGPFSGLSRT